MPRASQERTDARRREIIRACARLYETMSFKDITVKEIGAATSFTRTSIYNYFHTKEEIFLALLQLEYQRWVEDLAGLGERESMSDHELAHELAASLERRALMLKIMSMNHYDMEANSRMERLVEFKAAYGQSLGAVEALLEKFRPDMTQQERRAFLYTFFPFIYGIYPYAAVSDKQHRAMEEAGVPFIYLSIYDLAYACVIKLLAAGGETTTTGGTEHE